MKRGANRYSKQQPKWHIGTKQGKKEAACGCVFDRLRLFFMLFEPEEKEWNFF